MKRLLAVIFAAASLSVAAEEMIEVDSIDKALPCHFGDWNRAYRVTIREGCKSTVYRVTCGGFFGNQITSVVLVSIPPPCQNL
jgi:hypothetical protein